MKRSQQKQLVTMFKLLATTVGFFGSNFLLHASLWVQCEYHMYRLLFAQLSPKNVEEEMRFRWKIVQIFKCVKLKHWNGYITSHVLTFKTNPISQLQHLKSNPLNLRSHTFLGKIKHTIIITTLENGEVYQL